MHDEDSERYQGFTRTLKGWRSLDGDGVTAFVDAALDDRIGQSAVIDLIAHPAMTADLLEGVAARLPVVWTAARARLKERRVRLPLEGGTTDEQHQFAAVRQGSRNVQLWLLDNVALSQAALGLLAAEGATRAIRNRAAQRVRSDKS